MVSPSTPRVIAWPVSSASISPTCCRKPFPTPPLSAATPSARSINAPAALSAVPPPAGGAPTAKSTASSPPSAPSPGKLRTKIARNELMDYYVSVPGVTGNRSNHSPENVSSWGTKDLPKGRRNLDFGDFASEYSLPERWFIPTMPILASCAPVERARCRSFISPGRTSLA